MDNPSPASSSASTAITSFSPGPERNHNEADSPKYTTAGTIYNPKAVQPIKPPTRLRRAFKWPPDPPGPSPGTMERSLFPKSALEALSLQEMLSPYDQADFDSAPARAMPVYNPLQQNQDRAVTPPHAKKDIETPDRIGMSAPRSQSRSLHSSQSQPSPGMMTPAVNGNEVDEASQQDCAAEEDGDLSSNGSPFEHALGRLTVKSLHNLASYPNPNQKRALKLLQPRPRLSHSEPVNAVNNSRFSIASVAPQTPGHLDTAGRGRQSRSPAETRSSRFSNAPPREPKNRDTFPSSRAHYLNHNRQAFGEPTGEAVNVTNICGGYKSTLATGPGAPLPLTAGPPGHRQYNPSTFDSALRALHSRGRRGLVVSENDAAAVEFRALVDSNTRHHETRSPSVVALRHCPIMELAVSGGAGEPPVFQPDRPLTYESSLAELRATSFPEVSSRHTSPVVGRLQSVLHAIHTGDDVVDTKFPEEVRKYYPYGMPNMHEPITVSEEWATHYPLLERRQHVVGSFAKTCEALENLENRNRKVYHQFHAAADDFPDSMDVVIQQAHNRRLQRSVGVVGVIGDRRRSNARVACDPLEVEQVNNMPLYEAAGPLLPMVFATLLHNLDYGSDLDTYCPWQKPPEDAVDPSCQGTFFGKSTALAG
ncbi:hypothetical protein SODALDRAFT_382263 [Sodiomyces alkalinus F11]|uniref:Uncharacterized protein n=1 Tax=Sodiomyces alkalinus (strain CBS 110278 / VKM F-3762 / F11) TaxID=1314773 RepID=A0A3N2PJI2_SODAK|nr:hypothetical protein SODALDRAFT_382263 [Sodiomyces alkalinus F11]ROT34687.1 hypothetical protein SODALDRAFT_382263 [Sodiomyces alkalinus F11]